MKSKSRSDFMESVKAWKEKIIIPTYEVGTAEKYPIFLEKRVYQGSSGSVYPNPVIEKISDTKVDKEWEVIFMENRFIKIMVIPALGGRIQMAYDKVKERHFVYYNEVIKPALVGLTGPWISGGIEFNWPQHHRPSTYEPVDFTIEQHEDGSATVWVSEIERMFRTKGMAGFRLYPDKAYIEIKGKLFNRTPHPQTFLWWANPAVAVNDHYQSVFPEDVNAVFDHGKRDVSEFPIAKGTYYKVDYSKGVDISKYKNIPVPTSYMAINSDYDFVGGYENDTEAGLLHVANHHISPGKKQWTWGNGDFGHAWDRNLTDRNGPYIELMCGVFTDNQPDFAWIQPYEEKEFTQYFMPYQKVGLVKNATKDALLNVQISEGKAQLIVYATGIFNQSKIRLWINRDLLLDRIFDLSPESVFELSVPYEGIAREVKVEVCDADGKELVSWDTSKKVEKPLPQSARAAKDPKDIHTIEELYLTGLHIEQYRHATYSVLDYYSEGLLRDENDVRCNNALGLHLLRSGEFHKAANHFQKAIDTLTKYNPNPSDGEPFFNKGIALKMMGKYDEAYDAFFKTCWNAAFKAPGYYNLALIETRRGNFEYVLELVNSALVHNWHNHKARHLKAIIQRKLDITVDRVKFIEDSLELDKFNFGVLYEKYLLSSEQKDKSGLQNLLRGYVHNYIELALDYADAGLYQEAIDFLHLYLEDKRKVYPMVFYCLGFFYGKLENTEQAEASYRQAAIMPSDYCFPNRLEEVIILQEAIKSQPKDANALYYLGNFWMAKRSYQEAKDCWERSLEINGQSPLVLRNLSLLYFNKFDEKTKALECLERAFEIDNDSRLLMELDQLYKKLKKPTGFRIAYLEDNMVSVLDRDDVYLEYITLLNLKGEHMKVLNCIMERTFHPWEGGEGKVPNQYVTALLEMAKLNLKEGNYLDALKSLKCTLQYPDNLGEGKLIGSSDNDIYYWMGCVYHELGKEKDARDAWEKAAQGPSEPLPAVYYNDQSPDKILYQGLAFLKLGQASEANSRFRSLVEYGQNHYDDHVRIEYFAVSLPDLLIWEEDLNIRNQIHCDYMIALGYLGLGEFGQANEHFDKILSRDPVHQGAHIHRKILDDFPLL
ncbi:DUF5107 domain-containing protein [Belliella marina]|uniref:DUF5107 domain-containing protein n=1 Tax=Belliella marina TaxID=1644146 RepID=A0ABW4VPZ3_9BACT